MKLKTLPHILVLYTITIYIVIVITEHCLETLVKCHILATSLTYRACTEA